MLYEKREREREKENQRESVCVCVCVSEKERESVCMHIHIIIGYTVSMHVALRTRHGMPKRSLGTYVAKCRSRRTQ